MRYGKTILNLTLALAITIFVGFSGSGAASRVTEDLAELVKAAGAVAEVTVTAHRVQAEKPDSLPFTVVTLSVEKVYKGALAAGSEIQAEYIGGAAHGRTVVSPGQANLKIGDRAVVLLTQVPNAANWRVLAGDAGQIVLAQDGEGRALARRASGRFEFYVADDASLTGYRPVKSATIYADQMSAVLSAIVNTGRPVLENHSVAAAREIPAPAAMMSLAPAPAASESSVVARLVVVLLATTLIWALSRFFLLRQQRGAALL